MTAARNSFAVVVWLVGFRRRLHRGAMRERGYSRRWPQFLQAIAGALLLIVPLSSGCSFRHIPLQTELSHDDALASLSTVVVLPFQSERSGMDQLTAAQQSESLLSLAEVNTSFTLLNSTDPLTVERALAGLAAGNLQDRARKLGRLVQADAVLFGRVTKFIPRQGSALGGSQLAAAGFQLALLDTRSEAVVWRATYDATDGPLSENMLKFTQVFQRGLGYKDASQLLRFGLEDALTELGRAKRASESR